MFGIKILHRDESLLAVAVAGLLIVAIAALVVLPGTLPHRTGSPEAGALLAPPSNESLTEAVGAPGTPTGGFSSAVGGGASGAAGGAANTPAPKTPTRPGGPTTNPPPPNNGLLPDLPLLPPLPPPFGPKHGTFGFARAIARGIL